MHCQTPPARRLAPTRPSFGPYWMGDTVGGVGQMRKPKTRNLQCASCLRALLERVGTHADTFGERRAERRRTLEGLNMATERERSNAAGFRPPVALSGTGRALRKPRRIGARSSGTARRPEDPVVRSLRLRSPEANASCDPSVRFGILTPRQTQTHTNCA